MSKFPKPTRKRKKPIHISKIIRASVIERDKSQCQVCGGVATQLHHVLYKSYGGADISQNLICLCNKCHRTVHANGKKWFTILLELQQQHYHDLKIEDMKK